MSDEHDTHEDHSASGGSHGGHSGGHEEAHEGAPEWLISFADNVALLMGFFVILLAMNMAKVSTGGIGGEAAMGGSDTDAMMEFVISIREAFNNPVDLQSKRPEDQPVIRYILRRGSGDADINSTRGTHPSVQSLSAGDKVNITASVQFDDDSAELTPSAREVLADAGARLKDQRWVIEVRGHASPFEVMHNPVRARDLSYRRALAAAVTLVDSGLRWESLRIVACGDAQRIVPRTFDRGEDRTNQRVELIVTTDAVPEDPYGLPAGKARGLDSATPAKGEQVKQGG
jgi:flagellar motor protein MotB